MNDFNINLKKWMQEVVDGCHQLATNKELDLDLNFYVFQCDINTIIENPKIMILGANPGGEYYYSQVNIDKNREKSSIDDLVNPHRDYLYNRQDWSNFRTTVGNCFDSSVFANLIYFNTGTFNKLTRRKGAKEAIAFCKDKTKELITQIIKPQNIILLGRTPEYGIREYFDNGRQMQSILKATDGKTDLISANSINGIPTYRIHHPVMNFRFNTGDNLKLKIERFAELLK